MDTEQNNTAVKATLARLLGSDTFVTPQGMNNALAWLITMLKAEFHARPEPVRQEWRFFPAAAIIISQPHFF